LQSDNLNALAVLEQALELRICTYGFEEVAVVDTCTKLCWVYNRTAMQCLDDQGVDVEKARATALELLRKADTMTGQSSVIPKLQGRAKLRAVTLNNLGVFYQRSGRPHAALKFMDKVRGPGRRRWKCTLK
jgi:hypothetical protein